MCPGSVDVTNYALILNLLGELTNQGSSQDQ